MIITTLVLSGHTLLAQDTDDQIRLIIRVDDMGCSHATNTGILETFEKGIATSVEVMVPTPWYPEAISMLEELPNIDVGIHLTLTSEWSNVKWRPLTSAPSLVDERGYFRPMIWPNDVYGPGSALLDNDWKIEEVEQEMRAQIEMAKRDIPNLTHMSSHMGCLSASEETEKLFKQLAKEYHLDILPEEYNTQRLPVNWTNTMPPIDRVKVFITAIESLTAGNWLFVDHPAHDLPEQQAIGHPNYEHVAFDRHSVMKVLTDPTVAAALQEKGVKLIGYPGLKK